MDMLRFKRSAALRFHFALMTSLAIVGAGAPLAHAACVAPPANIQHWWPGNGNAADVIGNNDGTLFGSATYSAAKVGQGFDFAAANSVVLIPWVATHNITPPGFTLEFWEKGTAEAGDHLLVDHSHGGTDSLGWMTGATTTNMGACIGFGGGGNGNFVCAGNAGSPVLDSTFHHIAFTWADSDDTLRFYVDGTETATAIVASPANNTRALLFGQWWQGGRDFHGIVDEVSIYSRALSAGEIAAIAGAGVDGKCDPCGDGIVQAGEVCDTAAVGGDCCQAGCQAFKSSGSACTDDGNGCTNDTCNGSGTCQHPNNTSPCTSDGNECTDDVCSAGACTHPGHGGACTDDGNLCTDDTCSGGACTHPNNVLPCATDGNECTDDFCGGGTCNHDNTTNPCTDDGNVCTDDTCGGGTCNHTANVLGCDDGDACTENDVCAATVCGGTAVDCDDLNPCTQDSCSGGCINDPSPLPEASCMLGLKGSLSVKDDPDPKKDTIKWKLGNGEALAQADLGHPDMGTGYSVCLYDRTAGVSALKARMSLTSSSFVWTDKDPKGFAYRDPAGSSGGVTKVSLKTGVDLKSSVQVQAKGMQLVLPMTATPTTFFAQDPSLTIQLVASNGFCASQTFPTASASRNTNVEFKAKIAP